MPKRFRRAVAIPALTLAVASSALAVIAPPAAAADAIQLNVVGTSDVYDSNLVQSVIKPGFEATHPGVTLNYISKGTGAAISYAEAGSADALVVHAASLENQFVASGYSLEDYGRAIFYGDYVLLGPANDPAGVMKGASNDIVTAFEKVAYAGAHGKANFVSRGGTPGTTVQEHAIWALTDDSKVSKCTVDPANGGGEVPSTADVGANCSLPGGTPPSWYQSTGLTQGPNILAGDTCNFPGRGCYVFTDRGTFQYLQSTGAAQHLQVVTSKNFAGRRGGATVLINSFHAYGINPDSVPNGNANLHPVQAEQFLQWITSPDAQTAIGAYLQNAPNGGAPFIPSAAPSITTPLSLTSPVKPGTVVSVAGTVKNPVPGTPPLAGRKVSLTFVPSFDPTQAAVVATATTTSTGTYTLKYQPTAQGSYTVSTDPLHGVVENSTLNPVFADDLAAGTSDPVGPVVVSSSVTATVTGGVGGVPVTANLAPRDTFKAGTLELWAAQGANDLSKVGSTTIPVGASKVTAKFPLGAGTWRVQVHYVNDGVVPEALSSVTTVVVR